MEKDYKKLANELRKIVLGMTFRAQSSHIGSNFSVVDIMTIVYDIADFTPAHNGLTKDIVLPKSWTVATAYACLVRRGLLLQEAIDDYGKEGTKWTTIAEPTEHNGLKVLPFSTGAMGYILPAGVGFALAKKLNKEEGKVYCIISDGEMQIGATWEAALIAAHHKLNNLTLVVDWNGFCAMGKIKEILDVEPLADKWRSFNWHVINIDGHNHSEILRAIKGEPYVPKQEQSMPRVIIARTTKGYPISFMSNNNLYHYKHISTSEFEQAMVELDNGSFEK